MTATSSPLVPATGGLRSVVARHPVPAMLIMMFVIGWAVLMPPALAGIELVPFFLLIAVLFAQLLPAVLVTAAVGGRPAVRELFSRVFRWRVRLLWYLVALFAIPVTALLLSVAFLGTGAVHALFTDPSIFLGYLASITALPLVNLWEETAWTGVVQARLAVGRGPLLAAAITGVFFTLVHLPLRIGEPLGELVVGLVFAMILGTGLRILTGWLYYASGGSVLLAAIVHVTFNATNNGSLLTAAAPGDWVAEDLPWFTIGVLGLVVAVLSKGRLGARPGDVERYAGAPAPAPSAV
jgi:membrane protease YdiL (CAAX protease family)